MLSSHQVPEFHFTARTALIRTNTLHHTSHQSRKISSQHPFRATMEPRDRDGGSGLFTLHQIQTVHSCNEYTESPTNWARPQVSDSAQVEGPDDHTLDSSHSPQSERRSTEIGTSSEQRTVEGEIVVKEQPEIFEPGAQMGLFVICTQELSLLETLGQKVTAVEEQPCSFDSKQDVLEVPGSCISEQRSLASVAEPDVAIREQPKSSDLKEEETKLLGSSSTDHNMESKQETTKQHNKKHPSPCDRCRRCKCRDCAAATPLPSCWLCGRRCLCSAEAVVEYSTCVCCLKAVLYHCSSDDEDSSADAPFSCRESRRCTRWSTAAAMAFFLPCLLCYGPARGCLALCQLCHNCTHRTGCRCKDPKVAQDF
ncbi:protein sprouty-like 2 [Silurus asotus]|uniref:Protein sprouty-like 2 n=1 Tax=Silurus asotus TaxID=30991 RepID=A0AAD5APY7_SILAS|nr:protein sprouty-like 2 [Silurus asotus]